MPIPALLLLLATLLPLISFGLLAFLGRRMGDPLCGWIAIAFAAAGFALSMAAMIAWINGGELLGVAWGEGEKPLVLANHLIAIEIDSLTIAMFSTITPIVALASAFSLRYLRGDPKFHLYFTAFQLLTFSMLALVLGGNLIETLIFWELLALAGYSLARLGKPAIGRRALIAFIINRIGDAGILICLIVLLRSLGNATFPLLDASALPVNLKSLAGSSLFLATAIRTTQYLFRAPIPAAALMQSITSSAAGVYLCARFFPVFTQQSLLAIAFLGLLALIVGAIFALRETDITRVMAWSTLSQFGLIYMAIGLGSVVAALFLLLCHAFFKSLLILTAGGIVHAAGGEKRFSELGGFLSKLPVCAVLLAIGILVISAAPFTSGYYSDESVLAHAASLANSLGGYNWLFFILPAAISFLTALYMTRSWMLIFWGAPRNEPIHQKLRERTSFWFPLAALAILSLIGGSRLMDIERFVSQSADESENYRAALRNTPPAQSAPITDDTGLQLFHRYATWPFAVGILAGIAIYSRRPRHAATA